MKKFTIFLMSFVLLFFVMAGCTANGKPTSETPLPTVSSSEKAEEVIFQTLDFKQDGNFVEVKTVVIKDGFARFVESSFSFNLLTKEYDFENANKAVKLSMAESVTNFDLLIKPKLEQGYVLDGILIYADFPYFVLSENNQKIVIRTTQESYTANFEDFQKAISLFHQVLPKPTGGYGLG